MVGYTIDHPFLRKLRDEAYANPKPIILLADCERAEEAGHELHQNGYAHPCMASSLSEGLDYLLSGVGEGFVAGANTDTALVARALIARVPRLRGVKRITSTSVFCHPDGSTTFWADTGLAHKIPAEITLEEIAAMTAETAAIAGIDPAIAYLSHRTEGKFVQFDTAVDPEVAARKGAVGHGHDNVFIFPVEAANIAYKIVQRLGNAYHMGPVFQGLTLPCSDLSRGADVDEIVNTALFVSMLARKREK